MQVKNDLRCLRQTTVNELFFSNLLRNSNHDGFQPVLASIILQRIRQIADYKQCIIQKYKRTVI